MNMEIGLLIAAVLIAAISIIGVLFNRYQTKKTLQKVINDIDGAIAGDYTEMKYDESMDSAIVERLNHFLTICQETSLSKSKEKDMIKSLVSDISHQTKTPIANIVFYSQLLLEQDGLDEKTLSMARRLNHQADKLSFLIQALMKSSYLETDMIAINALQQPVDRLIEAVCEEARAKAEARGIYIHYEASSIQGFFDWKWTLEALGNVMDNAIKYSPEDSHIDVDITAYEMFAKIDITDCGMGIPEALYGQIFQRFYRAPEAAGQEGFGIGLYLTREILVKQGGFIKVASAPGGGSVFSIFLCTRQNTNRLKVFTGDGI